MDALYAPWRLPYVTGSEPPGSPCVFCVASEAGVGPEHLVIHTDPLAVVLLNRYPYSNGHLLVVPRLHTDSLSGLPAESHIRCGELLVACERALRLAYACHGINMGLNLGEAAGAGIAQHLHWHAVPRWRGDTNFMTLIGETRVVPEEHASAFKRLHPLFRSLLGAT